MEVEVPFQGLMLEHACDIFWFRKRASMENASYTGQTKGLYHQQRAPRHRQTYSYTRGMLSFEISLALIIVAWSRTIRLTVQLSEPDLSIPQRLELIEGQTSSWTEPKWSVQLVCGLVDSGRIMAKSKGISVTWVVRIDLHACGFQFARHGVYIGGENEFN